MNSNAKKIACHRQRRAKPAHEINPKVPERVSRIIQKMMAKRPENRFSSAAELGKFLAPLADRKAIDFNFDHVLEKRAEIAEKRLAAESRLRADSRVSSISSTEIKGKSAAQLKQPMQETSVPKDTQVDA